MAVVTPERLAQCVTITFTSGLQCRLPLHDAEVLNVITDHFATSHNASCNVPEYRVAHKNVQNFAMMINQSIRRGFE